MTSAGHHTMLTYRIRYPWDYRVAYFELRSGTAYFENQTIMELNPRVENTTDCRAQIMQYFKREIVVSTPNVTPGARLNYHGSVQMGGFCRDNGSGYLYEFAGINTWLSNNKAPNDQFPFIVDKPILVGYSTNKAEMHCTYNNKHYEVTAAHSNIPVNWPVCRALAWNENGQSTIAAPTGTRFYRDSFECTHPLYKCSTSVVPCVKDGVPYICDMVSMAMFPKQGSGTIALGPAVDDDYDAMEE